MPNSNEYMRNYMLNRYYRRREEAVAYLGGVCVDCGTTEDLEFDHQFRFMKTFDIGKAMTSMSHDALYAELDKCELRCRDCHQQKTSSENPLAVPHGSGLTGKRNCRCEKCAPLKDAYNKKYR